MSENPVTILAEWLRFDEMRVAAFTLGNDVEWLAAKKEADSRAAILDRLCLEFGISMLDGHFCYDRKCFGVWIEDEVRLIIREVCNPEWMQALRGWLMVKNA